MTTLAYSQAPQKNWKDRAEYDGYEAITKEANAAKRLELLNAWKEKYANTDFKKERLQVYLATYQALGQPAKMIDTAKEILADDPKDFQSLYWITFLAPTLNNTAADALALSEKAANGLQGILDDTFSAAKKPANVAEGDWKKSRTDMEALSYKTLGWISMQRKTNDAAEQAFGKSLSLNPAAGEVSYWLGTVILGQKKPERQSEVLFHFARAASYDGPGALSEAGRKQVDTYFTKAFNNFHGQDAAALGELRTLAKANPMPPAGFKIKNVNEIAAEKEEADQKANPQLALWKNLKQGLTGADGDKYFAESMKGAAIPKLKGKLVSHKPALRPKELVIAIMDGTTPEITLKLDAALAGKADAGTELEFEGVPAEFSKEPFMVTFDVEKANVTGWPAQAAPAPAKKAPAAAKKAVKKG